MRLWRSVAAVIIGFVVIGALAFGADAVLHRMLPGAFDSAGRIESVPVLLFTLVYVAVFAISGCYLTARLAPSRPMLHALVLGALGLAFNVMGSIAQWDTVPVWYHFVAISMVLPYAWMGGHLRELQLAAAAPEMSRVHA